MFAVLIMIDNFISSHLHLFCSVWDAFSLSCLPLICMVLMELFWTAVIRYLVFLFNFETAFITSQMQYVLTFEVFVQPSSCFTILNFSFKNCLVISNCNLIFHYFTLCCHQVLFRIILFIIIDDKTQRKTYFLKSPLFFHHYNFLEIWICPYCCQYHYDQLPIWEN